MAGRTWVTRRRWKVAAAGAMIVVACGAAASLLQSMFPNEVAGVIVKPGDQLGDALGWWKWLLAIPVVGTMLATSAATTFFIIGALMVGLPVARIAAPRLHDRLLGSFDYDVLARIGSSQMDPDGAGPAVRLPWMLGSDGPRREAWDRLLTWCRGSNRTVGVLSVVVLVGRSGSGKTRMSAELGRELARRDRLGGRRPVAGLRERLGYRMRSTSRRLGRLSDPWDAGALRRAGGQSREAFIGGLLAWRPRRPSVIILDDPSSDIAEAVISALEEGAASFRHPVRLLIASQTVPQGSRFAFSARDRCWLFDGAPADPAPVSLPEEAWFDEATTRRAVFATRLLDGKSTAVQRIARERIHQVSEGNPLMVELALEWLVERGDLDAVTPEILSARRAARIVEAMRAAGIGDRSQIGAMTLATLVGGAGRRHLEAEVATIFPGMRELPPAYRLRACFPADPLQERDGQAWIPPVRPRLIADAFVEAVVGEELDEADLMPLLRAACRLDPRSFLARMAEVHLAGHRMRAGLQQLEPHDLATGDPVTVALAGAELVVVVPTELVRAKVARSTSPIQPLVHRLIELCEPTLLLSNLPAFVELTEVYPMVAWIRGDAYAELVGRVLRRCAERPDGSLTAAHYSILVQQLARWTRLLNRWGTRDGDAEDCPGLEAVPALSILFGSGSYGALASDEISRSEDDLVKVNLMPDVLLAMHQPTSALRPEVSSVLLHRVYGDMTPRGFPERQRIWTEGVRAMLTLAQEAITNAIERYSASLRHDGPSDQRAPIELQRLMTLCTRASLMPDALDRHGGELAAAADLLPDEDRDAVLALAGATRAGSGGDPAGIRNAYLRVAQVLRARDEVDDDLHLVLCRLLASIINEPSDAWSAIQADLSAIWPVLVTDPDHDRDMSMVQVLQSISISASRRQDVGMMTYAVEQIRPVVQRYPGSRKATIALMGCLAERAAAAVRTGEHVAAREMVEKVLALENPVFADDPRFTDQADFAVSVLVEIARAEGDLGAAQRWANRFSAEDHGSTDTQRPSLHARALAVVCSLAADTRPEALPSASAAFERVLMRLPAAEQVVMRRQTQLLPLLAAQADFRSATASRDFERARSSVARCRACVAAMSPTGVGWTSEAAEQTERWLADADAWLAQR